MNLNNHHEILEMLYDSLSFVFWKDIHGIYQGGNLNQAKAFGFASAEDFIGKTIFELLPDYPSAQLINANDSKVMETKQTIIIEEKLVTPFGVKTYLSKKQPIFDHNQDVIGLLGTAMDITEYALEREAKYKLEHEAVILKLEMEQQKIIITEQNKFDCFVDQMQRMIKAYQLSILNDKLNNKDLSKDYNNESIILTKRETEILYLLSLGKSPKDIASILSNIQKKSVSSATIGSMINKQLYRKFDVYNINQLIEKAQLMKKIPLIPDSLM